VIDDEVSDQVAQNTPLLKMNVLLSFCALYDYTLMAVPESPFEEFLDYCYRKS
jgi:hypothetical protein